jgi:hypothetical protein
MLRLPLQVPATMVTPMPLLGLSYDRLRVVPAFELAISQAIYHSKDLSEMNLAYRLVETLAVGELTGEV